MTEHFKSAMEHLLKNEGLSANVKADKGGQTYAGISRVFNPDWPGWKVIDAPPAGDSPLWQLVWEFYWKKYQHWQLDKMPPSDLVSYAFDTGVLFGGKRMMEHLQIALNRIATESNVLPADGLVGPKTISRMNMITATEREAVLAQLVSYRVEHHLGVVIRDPSQRKFLVGWLARASRVKKVEV
jgi:lysozyme family protein